jgi:uncharacterized membrane protein YedE/YeeE
MFESPTELILGLLTGVGFGFLLQKGRVTKYQVILGQLLLKNWTAFKIMIVAMLTGAIGVYALRGLDLTYLDIWPFQPAAMLIGAALFGLGIALIGYCPGTGIAAAGEGSRDAFVGVLGMIAGAAVFVAGYHVLEPAGLALGDWGKRTIPAALGVSPWLVIALLAVLVPLVLRLITRYAERKEPRGADRRRHIRGTPDRRRELASPLPG